MRRFLGKWNDIFKCLANLNTILIKTHNVAFGLIYSVFTIMNVIKEKKTLTLNTKASQNSWYTVWSCSLVQKFVASDYFFCLFCFYILQMCIAICSHLSAGKSLPFQGNKLPWIWQREKTEPMVLRGDSQLPSGALQPVSEPELRVRGCIFYLITQRTRMRWFRNRPYLLSKGGKN